MAKFAALVAVLAASTLACSTGDGRPSVADLANGSQPTAIPDAAASAERCDEGIVRSCRVASVRTLEGYTDCYKGLQLCVDGGTWTDCLKLGAGDDAGGS